MSAKLSQEEQTKASATSAPSSHVLSAERCECVSDLQTSPAVSSSSCPPDLVASTPSSVVTSVTHDLPLNDNSCVSPDGETLSKLEHELDSLLSM